MTEPLQINLTSSTDITAADKELALRRMMREMRFVLVAYSGGVDSTYLALIATQELEKKSVCVLGLSPSVSEFQRNDAKDIARQFGFNFHTIETEETADPNYIANPSNRCYFCKSELYKKLSALSNELNINIVLDGTNADDLFDHRPGRVAAEEKSVRSPLAEIGFTKSDIRQQSRKLGLPGWDKPASPCLSSRIAYGVPVTIERLSQVECGEQFMREMGFREFRVRVHNELVRLEIAQEELQKAFDIDIANLFSRKFKQLGFRYVTLDLEGYRSGAMNKQITN